MVSLKKHVLEQWSGVGCVCMCMCMCKCSRQHYVDSFHDLLSLVERVVPAMDVWLRLRTLCSRGSELSLDHIVLCLCLARCQKRQENRL